MPKNTIRNIVKFFLGYKNVQSEQSEFDIILKYITSGSKINYVDVGAHEGGFASSISSLYNVEKMILIEPIPEKFSMITRKFSGKEFSFYNCVVSDQNNETEFMINENDETSSILTLKSNMEELSNINSHLDRKIICKSRLLDEIINESDLDKIDLLKIDVQGAEDKVLNGAEKALSITRFALIEVSFKELYIGSALFHNIYEMMIKKNFVLAELNPVFRSSIGELLQSNALFINRQFINN